MLITSGSLNWNLYPGTMQDQVQKALTDQNGPMAADLAAKLHECALNAMTHASNSSRGGLSHGAPAIQAILNARRQEQQRQIAACQAVVGDHRQVRLQLLNVAMEQKVFGAANASFLAGVRTSDVVKQIVYEAREGHLGAIYHVATYSATLFGIDAETQAAVRYALKTATTDPTVGSRISGLLEHSEPWGPPSLAYAQKSSEATLGFRKLLH